MQVAGSTPVEDIDNAREGFLGICIAHVVKRAEGRYTHPNTTLIRDVQDCLEDLIKNSPTVGCAAAVGIGAGVLFRANKLVNKVSIGGMKLLAIKVLGFALGV